MKNFANLSMVKRIRKSGRPLSIASCGYAYKPPGDNP